MELFDDKNKLDIDYLIPQELPVGEGILDKGYFTGNINSAHIIGGDLRVGEGDNVLKFNSTDGLWLGNTAFNSAPFKVNFDGKLTCAGAVIDGTSTIGGRTASTLAGAIDASGDLITDIINDRFDTSAKTILDNFTFGASGAIQIGAYEAGVSGDIKISPNGILGRNKDNNTTFSIDATTGNATFAGDLVAASGTLGEITAGTFTGITLAIGSGNSIFKADSNGIYLGSATFASAPFRVNMAGELVATSADISGAITITSGSGIANLDGGDLVTKNEADVDALNLTNAPAAANADVTKTIIDGGLVTTGYITLDTAGNIKSGQTAYNTGTGFWLGNDGGTPKLSIGSSIKNLKWTGSALDIDGANIYAPTIATAVAEDLTGTFTVTTDTDTFNSTAHGLWVDNTIKVSTTGTLPEPLVAGTVYYIVEKTDNTFKVSLTRGGSVINITTTGSGTHTWTRNTVRSVVLTDDDGLLVKDNAVTRVQIYDDYIRLNDKFGNNAGRIYGDVLDEYGVLTIKTDYFIPAYDDTTNLGSANKAFSEIHGIWGMFDYIDLGYKIQFTPTSTPTSYSEGTLYYDSSAHAFKYWNGSSWRTISSS